MRLLATQLADPEAGWSLGTFGALATFTREPTEPAVLTDDARGLSVVTARGGVRLDRRSDIRLLASETALEDGWSHRVAICLPSQVCLMSGRTVVTELGPDRAALRAEDRAAILFDLGVGAMQVDACVRTADPAVAARLRSYIGRPIVGSDASAIEAIRRMNPSWVFLSRAGRAEVDPPTGMFDRARPEGPRVHVLPKLLGLRRTHATTEPIPAGFVPFAHCHPPHPGRDAQGQARPFDPARHAAFQEALRAFGDPQLNALKHAVVTAVMAGRPPDGVAIAKSRHTFGCVRVALRQLQALGATSATLDDWVAAYSGKPPARKR